MNALTKLNAKIDDAAAEFRRKAEARRRARCLRDPTKRDSDSVAGLRKLAARFKESGDPDFAAKVSKAADGLQKLLELEAAELESANAPVPAFVATAQNEAAAELCKKLPKTFSCEFDAAEFVKPLQFSEARLRENREKDERRTHAKKATVLRREFTQKIEAAATMATGEPWGNKAVDRLVSMA